MMREKEERVKIQTTGKIFRKQAVEVSYTVINGSDDNNVFDGGV